MKLIRSIAWVLTLPSLAGAATTLYDGSLGTLPQAQGYLAYRSAFGTATETAGTSAVTLNTTAANANTEAAGFSNDTPAGEMVNSALPNLDPGEGFDLRFTAKLDTEAHATNDRAGFSVILLGSDKKGVELGFWQSTIFAQSSSPLFTHAEGTTGFDPTTAFHTYDLSIAGSTYTLSVDGSPTLTGATRDYTAFGSAPYTLPNYVFLGDDTTSARGTVEIGAISVAVPEPATAGALVAGLALCRRRRRA